MVRAAGAGVAVQFKQFQIVPSGQGQVHFSIDADGNSATGIGRSVLAAL